MSNTTTIPRNPNFIILMTDQQRSIQYFPEAWVRQYLPNYQFFLDNGVVFENNMINTSPCGPSRASLFSGLYPATNQVNGNIQTLNPDLMNFTKMLNAAGYDVYYKGKFHMNEEVTQNSQSWTGDLSTAAETSAYEDALLEKEYGFKNWTSPDFGTALVQRGSNSGEQATLAAGVGNNDNRVVTGERMLYPEQQSALEFLRYVQHTPQEKPFCLVVSLLNPHDISLFPNEGYLTAGYTNALFENFENFDLPDSYSLDTLATKPGVQAQYLNAMGKLSETDALNYLKFYAYLHTLSDRLHQSVLNAIGPVLMDQSVIIRMADHGEMGMSHGGLQEKDLNMYDETIRVPMIWYHPTWFRRGVRQQLTSLIDLIPTMADFTTQPATPVPYTIKPQGTSYYGALFDADASAPDAKLFYYNPGKQPLPVLQGSTSSSSGGSNSQPALPGYIYGIVTADRMKYAVYFSLQSGFVYWEQAQFEMYDLSFDQGEITNLLPVQADGTTLPSPMGKLKWPALHALLSEQLQAAGITPNGWSAFTPG